MSQELGALVVTLEAQTAAFEKGMAQANKSLEAFGQTSATLDKQFGGMAGKVKNFNAAFDGIKNANATLRTVTASVMGLFGAIKNFAQARQDMMVLESSFKALLGTSEDAKEMSARVVAIAKEIGISIPVASDAVKRLSIGMAQMGYNNQQIAQVAETFLKIGAVGSSVQEAAGAVFQFSQAMGSGVLRGDELNSLLERQPLIAKEIAAYMKEAGLAIEGTIPELRKMGREGKITSKIMADGLIAATEKINEQYRNMPLTVEKATGRMLISWQEFKIRTSEKLELNENLAAALTKLQPILDKFLQNLTTVIVWLAENLEITLALFGALAVLIGGSLLRSIGLATTAMRAFTASTGIGLVIVALSFAIQYLEEINLAFMESYKWAMEIGVTIGSWFGIDTTEMQMKIEELTDKILLADKKIKDQQKQATDAIPLAPNQRAPKDLDTPDIEAAKKTIREMAMDATDTKKKIQALQDVIAGKSKMGKLSESNLAIANAELKKLQDGVRGAGPGISKWIYELTHQELGGSLSSIKDQLAAVDAEIMKATDPVKYKALMDARESVQRKMNESVDFQAYGKGGAQVEEANRKIIENLKIQEETITRLNAKWAEGTIAAKDYWEQLSNADPKNAYAAYNAEIQKNNELTAFAAERIAALNKLYSEGKLSAEEYWTKAADANPKDAIVAVNAEIVKSNEAIKFNAEKLAYINELYANGAINKETWTKLKQGVEETNSELQKMGEAITDAIANNANNAVNNFIDNIGKAKFSFSDFATSVIKDLTKMMMQMLIMKPLMESFKTFMGLGPATSPSPVPTPLNRSMAFAKGGSFESGTGLPNGIYDSPTLFKFAKGGTFGRIGMLGEAGAEAIMPLRRNSSGQLGVQAQASPTNIVINNNAQVEVTASESTNMDGMKTIDIMIEKKVKDMFGTGQMDKSMRSSYGLNRAAV